MPNQNIPNQTPSQTPPPASSPWDEPLPEESPKTQTTGSLGGAIPAAPQSQPFVLPQDIEKSMPPVVKATDIGATAQKPAAPAAPGPDPAFSFDPNQPTASQPPAQPSPMQTPVVKPVDSISGTMPLPATPAVMDSGKTPPPISNTNLNTKTDALAAAMPAPVQPTAPISQAKPQVFSTPDMSDSQPEQDQTSAPSVAETGERTTFSKVKIIIISLIIGLFLVLGIMIYLTESGRMSVGLEKFYGVVGIEKLWGGLPSDAGGALAKSLGAMKNNQQFKVSGTISLNIDKTIKNTVTTPLVSQNDIIDKLAVRPVKIILASVTSSSLDSTSSSSADTTSSDTAITSVPIDQKAESPYSNLTTTKVINTQVSGTFGGDGSEMEVRVVKPIGAPSIINLKNSKNNFWVKSDQFQFSDKAEAGKWLLYDLAKLKNDNLTTQAFSVSAGKGFSVQGSRQSNELVNSVRCYKYSLENVEMGDSLSGLGISSDEIQSISGSVWIGVSDKLIRKIDLKVTTSPSEPVIQINLSLTLSDFGVAGNFSAPSSSEVVGASATSVNQ